MVDWRIGRRPYGLRGSIMPRIDQAFYFFRLRAITAITAITFPPLPPFLRVSKVFLRASAVRFPSAIISANLRRKGFSSKSRAITAIPAIPLPSASSFPPGCKDFSPCLRGEIPIRDYQRKSAAKGFSPNHARLRRFRRSRRSPFPPLPPFLRVAKIFLRASAVKSPSAIICANLRRKGFSPNVGDHGVPRLSIFTFWQFRRFWQFSA